MYTKTQHQDIMNSTMMHELCLIWKWGFHDRVMLFQKESEITLNIYLFKGLSFLHTIRFAYLLYVLSSMICFILHVHVLPEPWTRGPLFFLLTQKLLCLL